MQQLQHNRWLKWFININNIYFISWNFIYTRSHLLLIDSFLTQFTLLIRKFVTFGGPSPPVRDWIVTLQANAPGERPPLHQLCKYYEYMVRLLVTHENWSITLFIISLESHSDWSELQMQFLSFTQSYNHLFLVIC